MIEDTIIQEGIQYVKGKIIASNKHKYIEYRNDKLRKIEFFEVEVNSGK